MITQAGIRRSLFEKTEKKGIDHNSSQVVLSGRPIELSMVISVGTQRSESNLLSGSNKDRKEALECQEPASTTLAARCFIQLRGQIHLDTQILLGRIFLPPNANECEDARLLLQLAVCAVRFLLLAA